jgi:hypothetical protein
MRSLSAGWFFLCWQAIAIRGAVHRRTRACEPGRLLSCDSGISASLLRTCVRAHIMPSFLQGKLTMLPSVLDLQRSETTRDAWIHYSALDAKATWEVRLRPEQSVPFETGNTRTPNRTHPQPHPHPPPHPLHCVLRAFTFRRWSAHSCTRPWPKSCGTSRGIRPQSRPCSTSTQRACVCACAARVRVNWSHTCTCGCHGVGRTAALGARDRGGSVVSQSRVSPVVNRVFSSAGASHPACACVRIHSPTRVSRGRMQVLGAVCRAAHRHGARGHHCQQGLLAVRDHSSSSSRSSSMGS